MAAVKLLPKHDLLFADFCRQMLETRDFDPNYYTVKGVVEKRGYNDYEAFRYCVIFNGFYWFKSADDFFKDPRIDCKLLKYGNSRRGFRGNEKVRTFISSCLALRNFIFSQSDKGEAGWTAIYNALLTVPGCGHWSAYCLTHQLKITLGLNIVAPNFGNLGSSPNLTGPIGGLNFITGIAMKNLVNNEKLHREIYEETRKTINWSGMEEMESCLCNYLSLHKNKYYVGRDIDRQLPALAGVPDEFFEARKTYFPKTLLGEIKGWYGIRKELMGTHLYGRSWIEVKTIKGVNS